MKNKKLLSVLASKLKIDEKKLLEASENEAGDDSVLKEFVDNNHIFSTAEVDTIKKNAREEGVTAHFGKADFDIDKDIPSPIANKLIGRKLEGKEKAIAGKYGVESYQGLEDLIEKLVTKSKEGKGNPDQELLKQIDLLKQAVIDKEKEVEEVKGRYVKDEINRHFSDSLAKLPLDYDEATTPRQRELLQSAYLSQRRLDKKGETVIVLDSNGKRRETKLGDPETVLNDLMDFAKSYGFKFKEPDPGGRGSTSSQSASVASIKGKTYDEYRDAKNSTLPEGQKIKPHTNDDAKLFLEYEKANKN